MKSWRRQATCIFEYIYFARPDSIIDGRLVYLARQAMGAQLAEEYPVEADLVVGVPDSATVAGIGYAQKSGIPHGEGLMKNRYVGRTFIAPDQRMRDLGVKMKFNPLPDILRDKRVVLVDDSIVRGTTTPKVINLLRKAGAKEVHMRVCAPPIRYPCFFGVDMASRWELIAAHKSLRKSGNLSAPIRWAISALTVWLNPSVCPRITSAWPVSPAIIRFRSSSKWTNWPWKRDKKNSIERTAAWKRIDLMPSEPGRYRCRL